MAAGARVVPDGTREVPAGTREDPDGTWEVVADRDGAREEATVVDGPTVEDRAMPSRTATTIPWATVLAVAWEDGPRELQLGPRATLAGLVIPEDGAREDGQARPAGAPEVETRDGPERLTAPAVMEVTLAAGQQEAMVVETADGLPEVETSEDGARVDPVDGNGKNIPLKTTSSIIL